MNRLVIANLLHRPIRSLISVTAIAVEVVLILVVVGLLLGMVNDSRQRQQGVGADIIVQPPGTSFLLGLSGLPAFVAVADKLRALPHVTATAPVGVWATTTSAVETIDGIELKSFENVAGPFRYLAGGPFQHPDDVLVDDVFAEAKHVQVGQQIEVLNQNFRVVGIVEHGKLARKYIPLKTMQQLIGAEDKASMFFVKLDHPNENLQQVMGTIKQMPGMGGYKVYSMQEWISLMTPSNLPGLSKVIDLVIAVAMIIGFIVIFQSMYAAVMERTREIGILKSLGASQLYIVNLVLRETVLLAVMGTIIGIGTSFLVRAVIKARLPLLTVMIKLDWIEYSAAIAVIGAIIGAGYPALKAAQKDPIDALAYE